MKLSLKTYFTFTASLFLIGLCATLFQFSLREENFSIFSFSLMASTFTAGILTVFLVFGGMMKLKYKLNSQIEQLTNDNEYLKGLVDTLSGQSVVEDQDERREGIKLRVNKIKVNIMNASNNHELLTQWCKAFNTDVGILFSVKEQEGKKMLKFSEGYAFYQGLETVPEVEFGVGLTGKSALENRLLNIHNVPEGHIELVSGLGSTTPKGLIIIPISEGEEVIGVMEMARLKPFDEIEEEICMKAIEEFRDKLTR